MIEPTIPDIVVKPGYLTTEFHGKCILQLALILNMMFDLGVDIDDATALTIVGGLEAIYSIVRGVVKAGPRSVTSTFNES